MAKAVLVGLSKNKDRAAGDLLTQLGFAVSRAERPNGGGTPPDADLYVFDATSGAGQTDISAFPGTPALLIIDTASAADWESALSADDFIVHPWSEAEFELRVKRLTGQETLKPTKNIMVIDQLVINPENYEVTIDGRLVALTYKEYELLKYLAGRPGRVFSRQTLLNQVWEYDYFGGTRTVDVHIRRVRAKLGRYESLIQTVRQVGYRFSRHA